MSKFNYLLKKVAYFEQACQFVVKQASSFKMSLFSYGGDDDDDDDEPDVVPTPQPPPAPPPPPPPPPPPAPPATTSATSGDDQYNALTPEEKKLYEKGLDSLTDEELEKIVTHGTSANSKDIAFDEHRARLTGSKPRRPAKRSGSKGAYTKIDPEIQRALGVEPDGKRGPITNKAIEAKRNQLAAQYNRSPKEITDSNLFRHLLRVEALFPQNFVSIPYEGSTGARPNLGVDYSAAPAAPAFTSFQPLNPAPAPMPQPYYPGYPQQTYPQQDYPQPAYPQPAYPQPDNTPKPPSNFLEYI